MVDRKSFPCLQTLKICISQGTAVQGTMQRSEKVAISSLMMCERSHPVMVINKKGIKRKKAMREDNSVPICK